MKVAFWNGIRMSDDVINYMAAIGIILALEYNCEIILSSNYISNHMLQDCFSGKFIEEGNVHAPYRFFYGSAEYCRALWSMKGNSQNNILEIPMEGVTIVYPPDVSEKSMFYYQVPKTTYYLLNIAGENRTVFQKVMDEADLFIVFLPQDVDQIQKFFHRFLLLIPKAIFVIEENQRSNRLGYRKLMSEYGIKNKNIIGIPKCNEYKYACEEGKLESFLKQNQATKDSNYTFVSGIKSIAQLLHERSIPEG